MVAADDRTPPAPHSRIGWRRLRRWFIGLLLLSGLIVLVSHAGELEQFALLLRRIEPAWLLLAVVLQAATYASVALVWHLSLRRAGTQSSFCSLIPLGVAKLFSDQAMPSGGMSGTAFFVAALNRRGIPNPVCLDTLLVSLLGYYGAYLLAALAALVLLFLQQALQTWIVLVAGLFAVIAVGIPAGALWLRNLHRRSLPRLLLRIPGLTELIEAMAQAPRDLLRSPTLLAGNTALHGLVFVFDAATLWVMLHVVGVPTSFWVVFPAFVLASMVATVGPIPLGLGTFEATCVALLGALGAPLEAALTATLLLRGFTLWLPMLPGMWLARRALR